MGVTDGWYGFDNDMNAIMAALDGCYVYTGLAVAEDSPKDMGVVVAAGTYYANGTRVVKGAETDLPLDAAHGTLHRKDLIVGDSGGTISFVKGTAAAKLPSGNTGPQTYAPVPPDIPANKTLLAEVWVLAAATTIADADITDRRVVLGGASVIENVPAGGIAAVTVQAAITELDVDLGGLKTAYDAHDHSSGDPTQVLEAIVKRLQVTGPVTLLIGTVADGQFLKRDGTAIVGGVGVAHNLLDGSAHPDTVAQGATRGSIIVSDDTPEWNELVIGAAARYLRSDGTDLAYAQIPASEVVNTPAGDIAATDVQAAIDELDDEKSEVAGCHGTGYPINNQTINEGNTYTSGDLRGANGVAADAIGIWMILHGQSGDPADVLAIDSADDTPDVYSSLLLSVVANIKSAGLVMVNLGTGGDAGKVKIKALTGNWTFVFGWVVGYWR